MSQGQGGGFPPRIFTEEEIAQVEAYACVLTVPQIAAKFGVAQATFYDIMNRQPEVSVRYQKGKANKIQEIAMSLTQKAIHGDTTAAIFYLKTQGGWKETQVQEHTGSIEVTEIKRTIVDSVKT